MSLPSIQLVGSGYGSVGAASRPPHAVMAAAVATATITPLLCDGDAPAATVAEQLVSLPTLVEHALGAAPLERRSELLKKIGPFGGAAGTPRLAERLQSELTVVREGGGRAATSSAAAEKQRRRAVHVFGCHWGQSRQKQHEQLGVEWSRQVVQHAAWVGAAMVARAHCASEDADELCTRGQGPGQRWREWWLTCDAPAHDLRAAAASVVCDFEDRMI